MPKPKRATSPDYIDHAVRHLRDADPTLAKLMDRVGDCGFHATRSTKSPFLALAESIAYQQLNGKAAATIWGRFDALFPGTGPTPEGVLAASDEAMRGAGLSRAKMLAIRDLAAKTLDGTVPTSARLRGLDDEEIVERLTSIRGIGRWTAEMLLMFRLGRPDVLPATDYGVRKGFSIAYRKRSLPTPAKLLAHGERWRPYRSVASWYLWRAVDLGGEKKGRS
ncbi:MAG TPA: DNA-3-methyladenine glycosylase [Candidatus Eisenbacteria bacterium]|nr:DNA-3-methyladenine glycosylase [Candidatus Eisenbacteria bacterium]